MFRKVVEGFTSWIPNSKKDKDKEKKEDKDKDKEKKGMFSMPSMPLGEDVSGSDVSGSDLSGMTSFFSSDVSGEVEPVPPTPPNPADLEVDDSIPEAPSSYTMFGNKPAPPSDEEVSQGTPMRQDARQQVLNDFNSFIGAERREKRQVRDGWQQMPKPAIDYVIQVYKLKEVLAYKKYIREELAWWNANIEVSPRQVTARSSAYTEKSQKLKEASDDARNTLKASISDASTAEERSKKESDKAVLARTPWDDVWSAFKYAMSFIGIILYILIALRFAGFASNSIFYKPLAYRILTFTYTFLFAPFFLPYYLYRQIAIYIWPNSTTLPRFEGLFPVNPYDPTKEITMNNRLFGYADTPDIKKWVEEKRQAEIKAREEILG
jgi:hypothetical protein